MILNSTACTSRIVVVTPRNDSSVTPLNLIVTKKSVHFQDRQSSILEKQRLIGLAVYISSLCTVASLLARHAIFPSKGGKIAR